ncbi:MAG: sugar ABC transporter substrate-binding protein, partial [Pseudomonadota bacterium]|nr:sugar ABC transporter substrate-binding protein [Pseudomonadota bacterium]
MNLNLLLTSSALALTGFAAMADTVGIAMPTQSSSRWISDGNSMVEQFEAAGYDTIL